MEPRRRTVSSALALYLCLVAPLILSGCGARDNDTVGASGNNQECVADAKAQVDAMRGEVKFNFDGPKFDASSARGKVVYWVALTGDIPFTKAVYGGFKKAADAAGLKVNFFDGRGQTSEQLRGLQQAVAAKADLIVLQSIPVGVVGAAVREAQKAGIPIVEAFNADAGEEPSEGATAAVSFAYSDIGKLLAASVANAAGCDVDAVAINSSDVPVANPEIEGIKAGFKDLCPETCKVDVRDALIADWSTKIGPLARNAVADSKVNWLMPVFDGMVQFATPAVRQANAGDRVKIGSFNASPGIVDELTNDGSPFVIDLGTPLDWTGWSIADQSLRILAGQDPVKDEQIPARVFDQDNAKDIDFKGPESEIYGGDYENEYKKLWGLE